VKIQNYIEAENSNAAFRKLIGNVVKDGTEVGPRGLKTLEVGPILCEIKNVRERIVTSTHARLSPIYPYIEGLWMLLGEESPDRLIHYSKFPMQFVNKMRHKLDGAYGPRLVGHEWKDLNDRIEVYIPDQLEECRERLEKDPNTRRAVCVINNPVLDWNNDSLDLPCTMYFQFLIRGGKLDLIATMRSQDLIKGFPNDVCEFQWFQEIMAGWLGVDLGSYYHFVGSEHVYEKDLKIAKEILVYEAGCKVLYNYDCEEPLNARLEKGNFKETLLNLAEWEEQSRTKPEFYLNKIDALIDVLAGKDFYSALRRCIVASNLNQAGYLEESKRLIEDISTDIAFMLKEDWKDQGE
jgi:thymidylate synthase